MMHMMSQTGRCYWNETQRSTNQKQIDQV